MIIKSWVRKFELNESKPELESPNKARAWEEYVQAPWPKYVEAQAQKHEGDYKNC